MKLVYLNFIFKIYKNSVMFWEFIKGIFFNTLLQTEQAAEMLLEKSRVEKTKKDIINLTSKLFTKKERKKR